MIFIWGLFTKRFLSYQSPNLARIRIVWYLIEISHELINCVITSFKCSVTLSMNCLIIKTKRLEPYAALFYINDTIKWIFWLLHLFVKCDVCIAHILASVRYSKIINIAVINIILQSRYIVASIPQITHNWHTEACNDRDIPYRWLSARLQ